MNAQGEKSIGVAILGGSGYGAGELLRLLAVHPEAEVCAVVSSSSAGSPASALHPQLRGFHDAPCVAELPMEALASYSKRVVIAALPHGVSAETLGRLLPELRAAGVKLIDLSGDFRLADPELRRRYYPSAGAEGASSSDFTYGLPELFREQIRSADVVSNPGCFALTCTLASAPLAASGAVLHLALDGKSGSSGAGRTPQASMHHPYAHANAYAYKVLEHRHEPEIRQALLASGGSVPSLSFVPHVIPTARGIYATAHAFLDREHTADELLERYKEFYRGEPFVRVLDGPPDLHNVATSNFCDVHVTARGRTAIAMAVTDNLVKGMAGTAIQNLNLMCGLDETAGLWVPGLGPC